MLKTVVRLDPSTCAEYQTSAMPLNHYGSNMRFYTVVKIRKLVQKGDVFAPLVLGVIRGAEGENGQIFVHVFLKRWVKVDPFLKAFLLKAKNEIKETIQKAIDNRQRIVDVKYDISPFETIVDYEGGKMVSKDILRFHRYEGDDVYHPESIGVIELTVDGEDGTSIQILADPLHREELIKKEVQEVIELGKIQLAPHIP